MCVVLILRYSCVRCVFAAMYVFIVCKGTGAGLRDSFSVWSFISVYLRLCELLPARPAETGPSRSSPLRPVAELRPGAYRAIPRRGDLL